MAKRHLPETIKKGNVNYNEGIVQGIVILAVSEVQGVSLKSDKIKDKADYIKIDFNSDDVSVDVTIDIEYGFNVPDVAYDIQDSIKRNVEAMSRYKVSNVDVHVEGVIFNEANAE